jgi:hypothetical protein
MQMTHKWTVMLGLLVGLTFGGCASNAKQDRPEVPLLMLGVRNPPLLPSEKAHPVKLSLRSYPPELSTGDLLSISNLVGRVPRLPSYEVTLITTSTAKGFDYDVWVRSLVIRVTRNPEWHVGRVEPVAY